MMKLSGLARSFRPETPPPGSGILLVFRQGMRARCPVRDLIWMSVLVLMHQSLALALQSAFIPLAEYNSELPRFLLRWVSMSGLVGAVLLMPIAAVLGAFAVPARARFEQTQSALMTHLTPLDLCAGRLLASLWPLLTSLLASCGLWLAVQIVWRVVPGPVAGYAAIVLMHSVLFCAVFTAAGLAFLLATRRRPGRSWGRGAGVGILWSALCVGGILLINPIVRRMNDPTPLINTVLVVNPASAAAVALNMDVLRLPWVYEHSEAHEYPFAYPPVWTSCLAFCAIGAGAMALAARRTRHAYR